MTRNPSHLPSKKDDPFAKFMKDLSGSTKMWVADWVLGEQEYALWKQMEQIKEMQGLQARMLFNIEVH